MWSSRVTTWVIAILLICAESLQLRVLERVFLFKEAALSSSHAMPMVWSSLAIRMAPAQRKHLRLLLVELVRQMCVTVPDQRPTGSHAQAKLQEQQQQQRARGTRQRVLLALLVLSFLLPFWQDC